MAQHTSGLHALLSIPTLYNLFQTLVGVGAARGRLAAEYFDIHNGNSVLDIGCGTAEVLSYLPREIHYVGFDLSTDYIEAAKRKYGERGEFVAKLVTDATLEEYAQFDRVLAYGLLHHLDDDEALHLFRLAKHALNSGGRFISVDPCYVDSQSAVAKMIIDRDRGMHVRRYSEYRDLAESVFDRVDSYHLNDLLRIPYDHAILVCS